MSHTESRSKPRADRNFDEVADHFAQKVYGGLKGQIRLAVLKRDLDALLPEMAAGLGRPLRILDVGAGLAQLSLMLAAKGHECTITDVSSAMLAKAQSQAQTELTAEQLQQVHFITGAYQDVSAALTGHYDVILCHALLEWLESPADIMAFFNKHLAVGGLVSLCFYNPAAPVYRNLIMGNFNHLNRPKPTDSRTLTPTNPVARETVLDWLAYDYDIVTESGIRTFYDYAPHKRGGLSVADAVIEMELKYSTELPFRLMGRYLHIMAKRR